MRKRDQLHWLFRPKPEAIAERPVKQRRSETKRDGEPSGFQIKRFASVLRGKVIGTIHCTGKPNWPACHHRFGRNSPFLQQCNKFRFTGGGHIESSEVEPVLGRSYDATLVLTVKVMRTDGLC